MMEKEVLILLTLILFFFVLTQGCSTDLIKTVDIVKYQDTNVTYSNLSCHTDAEIGTISKYTHTCSFDVTDKAPDENSIINIEYSYCQFGKSCYYEDKATLNNFKPEELRHFTFKFEDILVNRLSLSKPVINFKAIRTVYYVRQ